MNKVTRLLYVAPPIEANPNVAADGMVYIRYGGMNAQVYPTHEQIEAHVAEMNRENWKLISVSPLGLDYSLTFFWQKDVMLAELSRNEI